jgi:hypothetical protein
MFTFGSIPLTGGNGDYKVRSLKITISGEDYHWSGVSLLDSDGELLDGQRSRAAGLPASLSIEDVLAILSAGAPAQGFVVIPTNVAAPLAAPVRAVVVTAAGNLGLECADGSHNNANLIPVSAGQTFPIQAVRLSANNSAGVIGLVGLPAL